MGCDYYTWIETVIVYLLSEGKEKEFVEKVKFEDYTRNYFWHTETSYDPDFEDPHYRNDLEQKKQEYGKKYLFQKNQWICTESGKARILSLCEENKIPSNKLVEVYKRMNGYMR